MGADNLLSLLSSNQDRAALSGCGVTLTRGELLAASQELATHLTSAQAVGLLMENSPHWIIADLSCVAAGRASVPLPPFFTQAQIDHALKSAGVSLVITDQPERIQGNARSVSIAGKSLFLVSCDNAVVTLPQKTAKITFTSGSTGSPKGVCLTQESMETVAHSIVAALGNELSSRHLCLLPLAVLLENVAGVYASLIAGAECVLEPIEHQPQTLANAINHHQATSCILVPELLRMLMAAAIPLPSLRFVAVGGAKVDKALVHMARGRGIPVYEGYGLSECASVVTLNTPGQHREGSTGKPLSHIELRVSEQGEIMVKAPLFSGYLGDSLQVDEWYATGDLGELDRDGFLYIHGRRKNLIITSFGRNISPEWPESILASHVGITQAVVFGEARPHLTAVIVARDPQQAQQAIAYANKSLPDYAQIKSIVIATAPFLPQNGQMTGSGKLIRDAIYCAYSAQIEASYAQAQEVL